MKYLTMTLLVFFANTAQATDAKEKELTPHEQFCSRQFKRDQDILELENLGPQAKAARFIKALGDLDKCLHEKKESTK